MIIFDEPRQTIILLTKVKHDPTAQFNDWANSQARLWLFDREKLAPSIQGTLQETGVQPARSNQLQYWFVGIYAKQFSLADGTPSVC